MKRKVLGDDITDPNIGKTLFGYDFNRIYRYKKFYKFLNNNLIHYKFQYRLGLNIDPLPFRPSSTCSSGGLYFCEESMCYLFWKHYGTKVAIIEIPDNARVYVEKDKFKADKFTIMRIIDFDKMGNDFWGNILRKDVSVFKYVDQSTIASDELCEIAVQQYGMLLEKVKYPTDNICKLAVKQNGLALRYVKDQNEDICTLAVQQNGLALHLVRKQTHEICNLAVHQNPLAFIYVDDQFKTDELCTLAVKQNGRILKYVKNQTAEMCYLAVQQYPYVINYVNKEYLTEDLCILAVEQNGYVLQYIKGSHQTEAVCRAALQQNEKAAQFIENKDSYA